MKFQDWEYITDVDEKFWDRNIAFGVFVGDLFQEMPHTTIHGFDIEYKPRVFMEALTLQKAIFTFDQKLQDFVVLHEGILLLKNPHPWRASSFNTKKHLKKQINYTNL